MKFSAVILVFLRVSLGSILVYAGVSKLHSGFKLAEVIANYRLLPAQGNQILAVVLPWWEMAAGVLLFFGNWTRAAAVVAALLFGAFTVAVSAALLRGLDIECGCFGTDSATRVGLLSLAIDLAGLSAAIALMWKGTSEADSVKSSSSESKSERVNFVAATHTRK